MCTEHNTACLVGAGGEGCRSCCWRCAANAGRAGLVLPQLNAPHALNPLVPPHPPFHPRNSPTCCVSGTTAPTRICVCDAK